MGKEIILKDISKKYHQQTILKEINLTIQPEERVVLLGPSGSGKSTLLRMIAGLEKITSGSLYLGGQLANEQACGERNMAMVFQNYALYPHMTVAENITFALKANKLPKEEIHARLEEALTMLGLLPFKDRLPKDLSGGQRQRTALARAVVKRTDYFLLDEPLSNLDVRLRLDARKELVKIHDRYKPTFVYVTHDQIEAMTLADRIVVLNEGQIQMVDTPRNVYLCPNNVFTATFIGSPGMNILPVTFAKESILLGMQRLMLSDAWRAHLQQHLCSTDVLFGIRPEHIQLSKEIGELKGVVKYRELLGSTYALTIEIGALEMIALSEEPQWHVGEAVYLQIKQEYAHFFSPDTEENLGYPCVEMKEEQQHEIFASV